MESCPQLFHNLIIAIFKSCNFLISYLILFKLSLIYQNNYDFTIKVTWYVGVGFLYHENWGII